MPPEVEAALQERYWLLEPAEAEWLPGASPGATPAPAPTGAPDVWRSSPMKMHLELTSPRSDCRRVNTFSATCSSRGLLPRARALLQRLRTLPLLLEQSAVAEAGRGWRDTINRSAADGSRLKPRPQAIHRHLLAAKAAVVADAEAGASQGA